MSQEEGGLEIWSITIMNHLVSSPKLFPDWAGVKAARDGYRNCCPGETKLSTKWHSVDERKDHYYWPTAQVLNYCGKEWKPRYGYLITQEELALLRFSRERISSGLAAHRSPRVIVLQTAAPTQSASHQSHQRNLSITSEPGSMLIRHSSISSGMASLSISPHPAGLLCGGSICC